jgi:hypothetical protein
MRGRQVATMIQTVEQPDLTERVQLRLEQDKTYFLDNPNARVLKRPFVEGEALPYAMSRLVTVVEVLRSGRRTYLVGGKVTLIITPPPVEPIREKRYRGSPIYKFDKGRTVGRDTKVQGKVVKRELFVPDLENPGKKLAVEVSLESKL